MGLSHQVRETRSDMVCKATSSATMPGLRSYVSAARDVDSATGKDLNLHSWPA